MLVTDLHTYDQYGYALVAVLGTLAAVIFIQWLIQRSRWAGWAQSLHGVAPPPGHERRLQRGRFAAHHRHAV
jgi:hypothetical protein